MIAYTILTEPQRMFLEVNSRAAMTGTVPISGPPLERAHRMHSRMVKPGRMRTTPADEIAL